MSGRRIEVSVPNKFTLSTGRSMASFTSRAELNQAVSSTLVKFQNTHCWTCNFTQCPLHPPDVDRQKVTVAAGTWDTTQTVYVGVTTEVPFKFTTSQDARTNPAKLRFDATEKAEERFASAPCQATVYHFKSNRSSTQ